MYAYVVHTYIVLLCIYFKNYREFFNRFNRQYIYISLSVFFLPIREIYRNFISRIIRKIEKREKSTRYEMLRKPCEDVVAFIRDEGVEVKRKG